MRGRLVAWATAAAVIAFGLVPPALLADGDAPSDFLLVQPVYYPYQPSVSTPFKDALSRVVAQLQSNGVDIRVAIVSSPNDLGPVGVYFGRPQAYAPFLENEIKFQGAKPLLVVMPAGFGTALIQPPNVLSGVSVDSSHGADGLALSAIHAISRIAAAEGKPIAIGQLPTPHGSKGGGGGPSPLLTFGGPIILIALSILAVERFRRRQSA